MVFRRRKKALETDAMRITGDLNAQASAVCFAVVFVMILATFGAHTVWREGHTLVKTHDLGSQKEAEKRIGDLSLAAELLRPSVKLSKDLMKIPVNNCLQLGNDHYYIPDLQYYTARADYTHVQLLSHRLLNVAHPDDTSTQATTPLATIIDFRNQLAERGIELLVYITPGKPPQTSHFFNNPTIPKSTAKLLEELKYHDIRYFAPHPTHPHTHLKTDSHWTPSWMESQARQLSLLIVDYRPQNLPENFLNTPIVVNNAGDLVWNTDLHKQTESITTSQISIASQAMWRANRKSPILLLGDSFTNIFSDAEMGWGESAGLAETLSYHLDHSIDKIAVNGDGALSSRRELAGMPERLDGKQLVIWQFAARELSSDNWQRVTLPTHTGPKLNLNAKSYIIEGTLTEIPPLPDTSLPYKDARIDLALSDVKLISPDDTEQDFPKELILKAIVMKDRKLTPIAQWKDGQQVTIKVTPWAEVSEQYSTWRSIGLDVIHLPEFWLEDSK